MPKRLELRTGEFIEINGVCICLVGARSNLAVISVATFSDGLLDGPAEVKTAANRWRKEFYGPTVAAAVPAVPGQDNPPASAPSPSSLTGEPR
jgi:hypothetical protein